MVLNKEYPRYLGASAEAHKHTAEISLDLFLVFTNDKGRYHW